MIIAAVRQLEVARLKVRQGVVPLHNHPFE